MEGELSTGNVDCEMEEEICMFPTDITEVVFNLFLLFYFRNKPVLIGSHSIVLHTRRQMQNAVVYISCRR